jgi:hypothetical protein
MLQASSAHAGECLVNQNPVAPSALAAELENGFGSLPGQLAGVPFSVVSYQGVDLYWTGCAADCVVNDHPGESQCGNLVETPVDSFVKSEVAGAPNPPIFAEVAAEQLGNGKWNVWGNAFLEPFWEETGGSASFGFALGTREVIDVAGSAGARPLDIRLRAGSHLGIQYCLGHLYQWIPGHHMRLRVTERTTFTTLLATQYYDGFFGADDTFTIDVEPGWVLQVDLWFQASANATAAQDPFGNYCDGAVALLDFLGPPASDGIQLFFAADPSLTLTPRSGIVYEAPEPEGGGAAALATTLLLALRRRART